MDNPTSPKDEFIASLDRCTQSAGFVPAFYRRFMSTCDEVREKFAETDFDQQNKMLVRSLRLIAKAMTGSPQGMQELRSRAETHDRHHLNIRRGLYDLWLSSVIETAREFDDQWSLDVEDSWKRTLKYAIDFMVRRY